MVTNLTKTARKYYIFWQLSVHFWQLFKFFITHLLHTNNIKSNNIINYILTQINGSINLKYLVEFICGDLKIIVLISVQNLTGNCD